MNQDDQRDAAWVRIEALFPTQWMGELLADPERLYRINSLLKIRSWERLAPDRVHLEALNLSNGKTMETELRLDPRADGLEVTYQGLLKTATRFRIEPDAAMGSLLTITDDCSGTPEAEREERLDEVDRSLIQWSRDLHAYLQSWNRWSWLRPWRWYMTRVWQRMKPSARRITRWIIWITAAELAALLLVFAIFVIEQESVRDRFRCRKQSKPSGSLPLLVGPGRTGP